MSDDGCEVIEVCTPGPQGPTGPMGNPGVAGPTGPSGIGPTGPGGTNGTNGTNGAAGAAGPTGPTGPVGGGGGSSGTFAVTLSGFSGTAPTGTLNYIIDANGVVTLTALATISGTSNGIGMIFSLPTILQPLTGVPTVPCANVFNDTNSCAAFAEVLVNEVTFFPMQTVSDGAETYITTGNFVTSGLKGLQRGWTITYPLL